MLAARMHGYHKPLELEDIKVPEILPDQVLVRVGGAGVCRSDVQGIDGYRGAGVTINTGGKSLNDLQTELFTLTGKRTLDVAIDCVGAEETIRTGIGLLSTAGVHTSVGLVGTRIDIPLFPFTSPRDHLPRFVLGKLRRPPGSVGACAKSKDSALHQTRPVAGHQ